MCFDLTILTIYFGYSESKHKEFAHIYESSVEITPSKFISDSIKIFKRSVDGKWKIYYVKRKIHLETIDRMLKDPSGWPSSVKTFIDIPSCIHRMIRLSEIPLKEFFPNIINFDEEYQAPPWLDNIVNTKRFSTYTSSAKSEKRREVIQIDEVSRISHWSDEESEYSEFTWMERANQWKHFFHRSEEKLEIYTNYGRWEIDIHPYNLSAVLYVLAWKISNVSRTSRELKKIYGKMKENMRNLEVTHTETRKYSIKVLEYLKDPANSDKEIRNLFIFFYNIAIVCEDIFSFREIQFSHGIIQKKTYIEDHPSKENTHFIDLEFSRSTTTPIQLTSTMILLEKRYKHPMANEYSIDFDEKVTKLRISSSYLRKIQILYTPHLLVTKRYGKHVMPGTVLYPLLTWHYLFGDTEDIKFVFLIFFCFIKQYSGLRKISSIPTSKVHSYFHFFLRRFPDYYMESEYLKYFQEPYHDLHGLQFGPSIKTSKKRKRDFGILHINKDEDVLNGFDIHSMNGYTALDSFISMKEQNTAIPVLLYCELRDIFQTLQIHEREQFINLNNYLFKYKNIPDEPFIFIGTLEILEEIYLFSISKFVEKEYFMSIWTRIKWFSSKNRVSSSSVHQIPDVGKFNDTQKQTHLIRYTMNEKDLSTLKDQRNISENDIYRIFHFFKAGELLIRYPVKFLYSTISTFCHMKEDINIISEDGYPYRGQVKKFIEFERIPSDTCFSRTQYPDIVLDDRRKRKNHKLSEVFPILNIEKREGRALSRDNVNEEITPAVDCDKNLFQTIILDCCSDVYIDF